MLNSVEYDVLAAGIDWLTCTAKAGTPASNLEKVAMLEVDHQRLNGKQPQHTSWQGFKGWRLDGLFFGHREHDVLLCLSGALSNSLALKAIAASTNVSRIDFAVTWVTNGEQLDHALDTWTRYSKLPHAVGRPRTFKLILGHPEGQTFYLNKRVSDNFGRIYDKGAETQLAPKGMVWRYEVEFKRRVAKQEAAKLPPQEQLPAYVSDLVRSWWTAREVVPPWATAGFGGITGGDLQVINRDVLTWYSRSVSVSIARSVKRFGLATVLEALGLQNLVRPIGGTIDGKLSAETNPCAFNAGPELTCANDSERILLQ